MFDDFRTDIARYSSMIGTKRPKLQKFAEIAFSQGIWALAVYRFGTWCSSFSFPLFSQLLKMLYFMLNKIIEIIAGISISSRASIGKGLFIGHFGGIFIHSRVIMGERCSISQGVVIGSLGLGKRGAPHLGNRVFIGSGAKVLGSITIGNDVRIGANAVVITDVPDGSTAVGIPARVITRERQAEEIRERLKEMGGK